MHPCMQLPLHGPPTSMHPATPPSQEQGDGTEAGGCHTQHYTGGNPAAIFPTEQGCAVGPDRGESLEHPASPLGLLQV